MAFGGVIKLQGETEYRAALKKIQDSLRVTSTELTRISSLYDKNDSSINKLSSTNNVLTDRLELQKSALSETKTMLEKAKTAYDNSKDSVSKWEDELKKAKDALDRAKNSTDSSADEIEALEKKVKDCEDELRSASSQTEKAETAVKKWTAETNKAESQVNRTRSEIAKNNTELSELKSSTDKAADSTNIFADELHDTGKELSDNTEAADKAGSAYDKINDKVGNIIKTAAKATAALAGLTAAAVSAYTKSAVESYGEYEQLVGGVETLFGDSSSKVQRYAQDAYKTAGISANNYMEQATSFSASLLQGLGGDTEKAADMVDLAIRDMSDNSNKMGTDLSMIQNAYQGFAKDNFTMLDNLKLGYGGTKEEMARLLNDTKVVADTMGEITTGQNGNMDEVGFDKMIEAIHIVQDELGITGTTASEAADTLQGSAGSMKAAWDNLKVGIADGDQDIDELLDKFIDSALAAADNLVPRIIETVPRVVEGIGRLMDKVKDRLPSMMSKLKPVIKQNVNKLLDLIGESFPNLEKFMRKTGDILGKLIEKLPALTKHADKLLPVVVGIGAAFVTWNVTSKVRELSTAISMLSNPVGAVAVGISAAVGLTAALVSAAKDSSKIIPEEIQKIRDERDKELAQLQSTHDAMVDMKNATDDSAEAIEVEYSQVEDLWKELDKLTDASGRVKDEDKEYAENILKNLNEKLGTEYELTGNLIGNYQQMKTEIEDLIDKKRAMALLDNASQNEAEYLKNQSDANEQMRVYKNDMTDAENALKRLGTERQYRKNQLEQGKISKAEYDSYDYDITFEEEKQNEKLNSATAEYEKAKQNFLDSSAQLDLIGKAEKAVYSGDYDTARSLLTQGTDSAAAIAADRNKSLTERQEAYKDYMDQVANTVDNIVMLQKNGNDEASRDLLSTMTTTITSLNSLLVEGGRESGAAYTGQIASAIKELFDNGIDITDLIEWAEAAGVTTGQVFGDDWQSVVQTQLDRGYDVTHLLKWAADSGTSLGTMSGAEFAAKFGSAIDLGIPGIDTSAMLEWAERTGRTMGDLLGMSAVQAASLYNYSIDANADGLSDLVAAGAGINSASDAQYAKWGTYKIGAHARGGIITRPSISLIGEEGAEAVVPLENNTEWINKVAAQLLGAARLNVSAQLAGSTGTGAAARSDERSLISAFKAALSQMKVEMNDREMGRFVDKTVTEALYT